MSLLCRVEPAHPLRSVALLIAGCLLSLQLFAQTKPDLKYYLPDISYNSSIPTPAQYLGYEVGEWHVSHDQLLAYMRVLAQASDRIQLQEYSRSHENRPLVCLTITAPDNHKNISSIRTARRQLADPSVSKKLNPNDFPAVAYMGYSIHGNEASGSNASMLVAYYLAAAQSKEVEQLLQQAIILLDPCFNPDGLQRFSTWVNSRRSQRLMPDPVHDEFNESWPGGRTNHYWFDLNRDWLVAQQPETKGRVDIFQSWLPNILTDHHEMGSNSTFFFQPGVPSRVNPITPARNQELTARIGEFHAKKLSENKVLFFSGENYDDFYYGKGSTYPDGNGCIGILFEQASSRGSAQRTSNGLLQFPYTVRNQVFSSLSTLEALGAMRKELNSYLRDFFKSGLEEARQDPIKGYIFGSENNKYPIQEFFQILLRHNIKVHQLSKEVKIKDQVFPKGKAWVVPAEQANYRLVKAVFERRQQFPDSVFYDISAWTLPDAFGLPWSAISRQNYQNGWQGRQVTEVPLLPAIQVPKVTPETYAFLVDSRGYDIPRLLTDLHRAKLRIKVATKPFTVDGRDFAAGSLLIPLEKQPMPPTGIEERINASNARDVEVYAINNGLTPAGPDLGSNNFVTLRAPKVALVTGSGASAYDIGEVWHLLDTRYGLTPLLIESSRFRRLDINQYNVVILADGSFSRLSTERLRDFVNQGGTLIGTGASVRWLKNNGFIGASFKNNSSREKTGRRPYSSLSEDRRAIRLSGAIFEVDLDLSHPICYGYERRRMPMFQGDALFIKPTTNPYASPAVFTSRPLLAGYIHRQHAKLISGAAAIVVGSSGRGKVICYSGNPNFRAFWYGTNRLFANAIFFGNLISSSATERK